jgi:hypothetical protein
MTKTAFAVAIATLLMLAVSGTSQALPIAPPTGVNSTDNGAVTPVYWYHHSQYFDNASIPQL